ncbi:MAG: glycosyltransferase family 4 protein [Pseudomonadota bacterium]
MKIAFITQHFYPEPFSNTRLAQSLVERGHEVQVFPCVPNYPEGKFYDGYSNRTHREEVYEGVRIHRAYTIPRGNRAISMAINFCSYPIFGFWTMLRRIKGRPDVSFASLTSPLFQAFPAVFLRWVKGTPAVYWVQDLWPQTLIYVLDLKNPVIIRLLHWICGWLYRRADLILVQSEGFPEPIAAYGVPRDRIRVLPNSAPDEFRPLSPEDAPQEAAIVPQSGFRLMFAGNIGVAQGFETIIEAADRLRDRTDLTWVIVGAGRHEEAVRQEIARRGLDPAFEFVGRHPSEKMPYFFAHADAMLVCLTDVYTNAITVPFKVQCYMACGKPIIGCLRGEGARVIDASGGGLTSPAGDADGLAASVRQMLDMPAQDRARMGANSRAYFDANYAREKVEGDLARWLQEIADARR